MGWNTPMMQAGLHDLLTLPVADQAREVRAALSLNESTLSEVLRVTRPTLHDWLDGKEPNVANVQRLSLLLRILAGAGIAGERPLNARFLRQPLGDDGAVLLDALRTEVLDEAQGLSLLREAKALGEQATSRRNAREHRLRALGFEEPSAEQRREQLARNIAMRDWPKT